MKRVFVTGEDGMLAREIERQLFSDTKNYDVVNSCNIINTKKNFKTNLSWAPEYDINNPNFSDELLRLNVDAVIHTAAICGSDKCAADVDTTFQSNVVGTMNVAKACLARDIKLIYFSTTAIYDVSQTSAVGKIIQENSPQKPMTFYGATKQAGENIVRALLPANQFLVVRPCFVYGSPRDTSSNIAKMIHASFANMPIQLLIDPTFSKDYLYTEDFGTAFKVLMDANAIGDVNISSGKPVTYSEIVRLLRTLLGGKLDVSYLPKTDYLQNHIVDNTKMLSYGWRPTISLQEGMRRQIESIHKSGGL